LYAYRLINVASDVSDPQFLTANKKTITRSSNATISWSRLTRAKSWVTRIHSANPLHGNPPVDGNHPMILPIARQSLHVYIVEGGFQPFAEGGCMVVCYFHATMKEKHAIACDTRAFRTIRGLDRKRVCR
jgi:hypothetical protein